MGQHWINILEEGKMAFEQERYSLAFDYYTIVLAEVKKPQADKPAGQKNFKVVTEFCECTQLAGKTAQKEKQWAKAEAIYKDASDDLIPFICNFKNGLAYRSFTVTKFKSIFYDLAEMYVSNNQRLPLLQKRRMSSR